MASRRRTALTVAVPLLVLALSRPARCEVSVTGLALPQGARISGVALDVEGRPLVNAIVRLRSVSAPIDSTPVVVARTDHEGTFSFTMVVQGRYVVDVMVGNILVATSEPLTTDDRDTFLQIRASVPQQAHAKEGKGVLFWTALGAGIGAGTGLIVNATNPDCRSPDALCPLVPISLAITGGLMGLLFGLGR